VVVPIGGGRLCAGIASAVSKRFALAVYGVEPSARSAYRSFQSAFGKIERVDTIADAWRAVCTAI